MKWTFLCVASFVFEVAKVLIDSCATRHNTKTRPKSYGTTTAETTQHLSEILKNPTKYILVCSYFVLAILLQSWRACFSKAQRIYFTGVLFWEIDWFRKLRLIKIGIIINVLVFFETNKLITRPKIRIM